MMLSTKQFYALIKEAIEKALNVDSTNILDMVYETDRKELTITFQNGRKYLYSQVPVWIWEELQKAGSKGKYFNREIKTTFPYKEITDMMQYRYNQPGRI
jgi:hypothetical protein